MRAAEGRWIAAIAGLVFSWAAIVPAADQPQWGVAGTRNMVSKETGLPDWFDPGQRDPRTGGIDPATTKNVKWVVTLGKQSHGSPVVAEGKVLVGTNNEAPRDPRHQGDRGVLMCFDEATGRLLWQLIVPKLFDLKPKQPEEAFKYSDWYFIGLCSTPVVERGRAYLVTNACEVVCLDMQGMANGNDGPFTDEGRHMVPLGQPPLEPGPTDADIIWAYDMTADLGVRPHNASNCSVLLDGDLLYVCTSNGVEWTHERVNNPAAPTLIVLDKRSGRLVATDDFRLGRNIIHGQWSSPTLGEVNGRRLVFQGTGNGTVWAVEALDPAKLGNQPVLLKNVWWFRGHPLAQKQDDVPLEHGYHTQSYEVTANPVFYRGRVYVPITQDCWHSGKWGWLVCLDASKTGDITRTGLLWSFQGIGVDKPGETATGKPDNQRMSTSISTVSIADGLVYLADFAGRLYCIDAETGRCYWAHEVGGPVWGSTLVADGKVYLGTGRSVLWILAAGKELKVLSQIRMRDKVLSTPVAANGVLYVATMKHLYAVVAPARRKD